MNPPAGTAASQNWDALIEPWLTSGYLFVKSLTTPWALLQFGIVILCYFLALIISNWVSGPLETSIRQIRDQPRLLRLLAVILRRLNWIFFALILWGVAIAMREVTWPSRSYFISIAASLVTAWVVIRIATRAIRNRTISNFVAIMAWTAVGLYIVGLLDDAGVVLDSIAITLGEVRISLLGVLQALFLVALLLWLATLAANFVERQLRTNEDLTPSAQVLISKITKVTLLAAAFLVSLAAVGIDITALTIFSGAIGLGIGFGLQKVVSNLFSGMIILLDKSIKPGDVISLGDQFGWITSLRARYVSVVTRDGVEYLIPNEDFVTQQVVNWSYSNRAVRLEVNFGVDYDCDPHEVRRHANEAVVGLDRVLTVPGPVCHIVAFGDSSIEFVLRFWINNPEGGLTNIRGQVFLALWDTFKENNISIPYPHREIIMRTAEQDSAVTVVPQDGKNQTKSDNGRRRKSS